MKKLILLLVVVFTLISCGRQSQEQNQAQSQSLNVEQLMPTVDDCCNQAVQIAVLTERNAWLEREVEDLQAKLEDCLGKKVVKTRPAPTVTKTATPTPKKVVEVPQVVEVKKVDVAPVTRASAPVVAGVANLDYLRQGGEIIFCARANKREDCYFPHYAMQQGVIFNRFADNQVKGYNWKVEPTENYSGDYGVTTEGTFYVSDEIIKKSLASGGLQFDGVVEIKAPYTGWDLRAMTQEGNYWIYRTR